MIVACAFAAFAGGQAFAAEWPDGVQDNGIPAMVLTIDEKEFENVVESPDHSYSAETGSVKIYVPDGYTSEYTGDELTDSKDLSLEYIRGRGHSSWSRPKKPFKIKLNKGQNLLGMGTNKHWILLANAFDDSLIRNRLVGYMGRELGLDYTPKYVPVDFYVNDQYQGSYLLAQQIRIHETRVDIPELTAEDNEDSAVTGGYLLSLHPSDDGPDVIKTSRGVEFQAEEPSFAPGETGTAAQHDYISGFLQNLDFFGRDVAEDANGETRPGEGMARNEVFGHSELATDAAHLVLEKPLQRFAEFQMHFLGQSADVVVALDDLARDVERLDAVGVNRALRQPLRVGDFVGLFVEYFHEVATDDFALLFGVGNAF